MSDPRKLIIETDIFSDVDDAGALALAHHYADLGRVELLAIGVNTPSRYGYRAVRAINAYFGRRVPVGALHPMDDSLAERDYAKYLADTYGALPDVPPEDAVAVHRRALAGAPDGSVTVVSLGFLHNLGRLLDSPPDEISPLPGAVLVARRVDRMVIMGGRFPEGHEFNITEFIDNARDTLARWPGPVDFVGWEVGAPVITGRTLSRRGDRDVIGAAYRRYGGAGTGRESWDLLAVRLAAEGPGEHLRYSSHGRVDIDDTGRTSFRADPTGRHRYAIVAAPAERLAAHIDALLERRPNGAETFDHDPDGAGTLVPAQPTTHRTPTITKE